MTPRQDTPRPVLEEPADVDSYPAPKEPVTTEIAEPDPISEEEEENLTDYGVQGSEYSVLTGQDEEAAEEKVEEVSPSVGCKLPPDWPGVWAVNCFLIGQECEL